MRPDPDTGTALQEVAADTRLMEAGSEENHRAADLEETRLAEADSEDSWTRY